MRKAKDNSHISKRYYRPSTMTCPQCGAPLRRRSTLWRKYVITLDGRLHTINLGYSCSRPRCPKAKVVYHSQEADRVCLKGSSFGFDLIVQIGWWRFWDHRTLDEIAALLQAKELSVSRRHILNLIGDFLALLRAAQPAKIETHRAYFQRHGMVISIDGMEPEQGDEMLFVIREANLRFKDTALATVFATILLFAFWIVSILDNVLALAMRARVGNKLVNHAQEITTSFEIKPLSQTEYSLP